MANRPKPKNIQEKELFNLLEKEGLTYADAARKLGCSRDLISKLMQGKRPFTKKLLLKLIGRCIQCK